MDRMKTPNSNNGAAHPQERVQPYFYVSGPDIAIMPRRLAERINALSPGLLQPASVEEAQTFWFPNRKSGKAKPLQQRKVPWLK